MSNQVKIFVVAHKPFGMLEGEALVPIHVGRAVSRLKDEMASMIGDDTGENISEKNPSYCEMTAHYWIWKNIRDCDYVGVCHYRGLRIKTAPYYKIEDGQKRLIQMTSEERKMLADYETMLQGGLARKVKEDRIEKFENPAILLGLKNDGIL